LNPGRVLIIDEDPGTDAVLGKCLRERKHEVLVCTDARTGFSKACATRPDCIVCAVTLPDIDGFWVARRIRTEPTSVATTPFLFLQTEEEKESRVQGLHVGGDAYLLRPFTSEEAVAQIEALIEMARRLRVQRESFVSEVPTSARGAAFNGDLEHMSLATVLMVLGMERRSGRLRVVSGEQKAELNIAHDSFASGSLDGAEKKPLEVLRDVLKWKKGKFYFRPGDEAPPISARESVSALLLEAMRLDDESRAR
jgi:DNA-binding response OmpR family regulator